MAGSRALRATFVVLVLFVPLPRRRRVRLRVNAGRRRSPLDRSTAGPLGRLRTGGLAAYLTGGRYDFFTFVSITGEMSKFSSVIWRVSLSPKMRVATIAFPSPSPPFCRVTSMTVNG